MNETQALAELSKLPSREQLQIIRQANLLTVQRRHEAAFNSWKLALRSYCRAKRGRISEFARALGVRRQSAWRWLNEPWSNFPAWAAVAAICWYFQQVNKAALSADLRTNLVSPQADKLLLSADPGTNLVSPQMDKL